MLNAVEMRLDPDCPFSPILDNAPPLCVGAIPDSSIFYEDFENGFNDWTVQQTPENPGTWEAREWMLTNELPDLRPGTAAFGPDPINGDCGTDLENGIISLISPTIHIPVETQGTLELTFEHYLSTEFRWDGGHLKYQLNDESWVLAPTASFMVNGYNTILNSSGQGNDNPMAGKEAFSGSDGGSVAGSWGRSVVDLSFLGLQPADSLRISWEVSTDGCNGRIGWYVDNVTVYSCSPCVDTLVLANEWTDQEILFQASQHVHSSDTISGQANITYSANQEVILNEGFDIRSGAEMSILLQGCEPATLSAAKGNAYLYDKAESSTFLIDEKLQLSLSLTDLSLVNRVRIFDGVGKLIKDSQMVKSNRIDGPFWLMDVSDLSTGFYNGELIADEKISNFSFSIY